MQFRNLMGNKKLIFHVLFFILFLGFISFPVQGVDANGNSLNSYETFLEKHGEVLLKEYHLPYGKDFSYWGTDKETFFYKSIDDEGSFKPPYWTKGDFNNDGFIDRCYLLFGNKEDKVDLFVFVSSSKDTYRAIKLASANKTMGVSTLKVQKGNAQIDSIKLFEFEGHATTYIWDESTNSFLKN